MALQKAVKMENGLTLSYHRITRLDIATNKNVAIVVASYPDKEVRDEQTATGSVYCQCMTYNHEYSEGFTIKDAYEYLKSRSEFDGAEDA